MVYVTTNKKKLYNNSKFKIIYFCSLFEKPNIKIEILVFYRNFDTILVGITLNMFNF